MATLTTTNPRIISKGGDTIKVKEATSSGIYMGNFIAYDSNGYVAQAADDAVKVCGIALENGTGVQDHQILMQRILPETEIRIQTSHTSGSSAVAAQTQIGAQYNLELTSNKHYMDIENSGTPLFDVIAMGFDRYPLEESSGDVNSSVIVKVIASCLQA